MLLNHVEDFWKAFGPAKLLLQGFTRSMATGPTYGRPSCVRERSSSFKSGTEVCSVMCTLLVLEWIYKYEGRGPCPLLKVAMVCVCELE